MSQRRLYIALASVLCLSVGLATASNPQPVTTSKPTIEDKLPLVPIFDGKTLDGWVAYKTGKTPTNWAVEDGAITRVSGGDDIMTAAKYDHFELELDWKISAKGNSGIMYRVRTGDNAPYFSGPEYQVLDDAGHGLTDDSNVAAGSLYGLVAAKGKTVKPAGEYNSGKIVLQGNHLEHWVNGKKVVDIEIFGDEWNKLVDASKFKKWSQFGKSVLGHIDFQDHGQKVWYKNIRIRPLPPPAGEDFAFTDITPGSSHALMHAHHGSDKLVVLDVRTPKEYDAGHLPDVVHLDFYEKDFGDQLDQLDRDRIYLVYCKVGGRSGKTVARMKEMGFRTAYNMDGGWDQWSAEKRPRN